MTAPNEAEIRERLVGEMEHGSSSGSADGGLRGQLRADINDVAWPLDDATFRLLVQDEHDVGDLTAGADGSVWSDLRTSEATRLRAIVEEATDRATERCEEIILEAFTAAGMKFAAEFPDAPRGRTGTPNHWRISG